MKIPGTTRVVAAPLQIPSCALIDDRWLKSETICRNALDDGYELSIAIFDLVEHLPITIDKCASALAADTEENALLVHIVDVLRRYVILCNEFMDDVEVLSHQRGTKSLCSALFEAGRPSDLEVRMTSPESLDP